MRLTSSKSFTLVELLITAYVLLVGISGVLLSYISFLTSSQSSWDTTVAASHAESILEEMQHKQVLADIIATDWNQWAQTQNLKTLPQETFRTLYTDPSGNPLDIKVLVEWQRNNGTKNISLETKLTR